MGPGGNRLCEGDAFGGGRNQAEGKQANRSVLPGADQQECYDAQTPRRKSGLWGFVLRSTGIVASDPKWFCCSMRPARTNSSHQPSSEPPVRSPVAPVNAVRKLMSDYFGDGSGTVPGIPVCRRSTNSDRQIEVVVALNCSRYPSFGSKISVAFSSHCMFCLLSTK